MLNFAQIGAISGYASRYGYDVDYQAWLDELTVQTYTHPSASVNSILSTMVAGMKSDGDWTELDRFWFFAHDGSSDTGVVDMINPSGSTKATKVNTPTWTSKQGFNTNGTTSYINSQYTPSSDNVNYATDSASLGIWLHTASNDVGSSMILAGANDSARQTAFQDITGATGLRARMNQSTSGGLTFSSSSFASNTLYSIERTSSTNVANYINGSSVNSGSISSTGRPTVRILILALNDNATPNFFVNSDFKVSVFWIGSGSVNHSQMYNRISTAMTAIAAL